MILVLLILELPQKFIFPFGDGSIQAAGISGQPSTSPFSSAFTIQLGLLAEKHVFLLSLDLLVNLIGDRLTT